MTRKAKYTIDHIEEVHNYMNKLDVNKKKAILLSRFSDSSSYYYTLRRLNLKEQISTKTSFVLLPLPIDLN